jgi:hypothetical protein
VPDVHVSEAFARSQVTPQAPQLVRVWVLVSQPLLGLPSQLAKPAAHDGTHAPAVHTKVPFAFVQAAAHAPQFVVLVFRFASQPFAALPSQLPKPTLHAPSTHADAEQLAPAFANEQALPHAPQLVAVLVRFVSHPFVGSPSQLPQPAVHVGTHAPAVHVVVPCALAQAVPQAPQLVTVVFRFVSQPFVGFESQLPKPALQVPSVHVPVAQLSVALARSHTTPQPPQFVRLVVAFSQPLFGLPSQFAKPVAHVGTQAPPVQVVVPFAFVHAVPQPPQFVVVFSGASQPVEA